MAEEASELDGAEHVTGARGELVDGFARDEALMRHRSMIGQTLWKRRGQGRPGDAGRRPEDFERGLWWIGCGKRPMRDSARRIQAALQREDGKCAPTDWMQGRGLNTAGDTEAGSRRRKTALFILIAVAANSFGNLLLAEGMKRMPSFGHWAVAHYLMHLVGNPFVIPGAALSALYTVSQLSLFSWADLSYVVPCTAASYIVTTLLGEFVMGEHIVAGRWAGVLLIFSGVVLVARTPTRTKKPVETARLEAEGARQ